MRIKNTSTKYHSHLFVFKYDQGVVSFCRELKRKYGYQQFNYTDDPEKGWAFSSQAIASEIQNKYGNLFVENEHKLETPKTPEIDKYELDDKRDYNLKHKLYDFQKKGVDFMDKSNGICMLADQMGLGKTAQAIAYAKYKGFNTLIVCPAFLKFVWKNEINKFTDMSSAIVSAQDLNKPEEIDTNANFLIINYGSIGKALKNKLKMDNRDIIILDESSYIKNPQANRSKTIHKIKKYFDHRIELTGTPILNRPAELWSQLNFLYPDLFPKAWHFYKRYCNLHREFGHWDKSGASNLDELRERIKKFMLRRKKENVLKELPPKTEQVIHTQFTPRERNKYNDYIALLKKHIQENNQGEQLTQLLNLRQYLSKAKLNRAKKMINNFLENEEKVVIFSSFLDPIHTLKDYFKDKAVLFEGNMSDKKKEKAINDFQQKKDVKVFLGSVKACQYGITLHASSNCVFLDLLFTPSLISQASDRLHRIGQKNATNIFYLITPDTIEQDIYDTLKQKMSTISNIMDEENIMNIDKENMFTEVMIKIKNKIL